MKKKTQPSKEELRLNKRKIPTVCEKCGFKFPCGGIFKCFCGITHQCTLTDGVVMAIPLAIEEGLDKN